MSVSRIQAVTARAGYRSRSQSPLVQSGRRGQVLLEFAVVAFLMTLLLGAMLAFGFLFYSANIVQQAADVGAQELARHPFNPTGTFTEGLDDSGLFDEKFLYCQIGGLGEEDLPDGYNPNDYYELQDQMPLINRLLFPLYIYDRDLNAIRYPGTVVERTSDSELTVLIPIVGTRDETTGVENITEWRKVVEEITPLGEDEGPYSINSTTTGQLDTGMVALRINYPYQSAALVAYQQKDSDGNVLEVSDAVGRDDITNVVIQANDDAVTNATLPDGYSLTTPTFDATTYGLAHRGEFGLGSLQAHATTVRPFRKVITAQGIYRREVFE